LMSWRARLPLSSHTKGTKPTDEASCEKGPYVKRGNKKGFEKQKGVEYKNESGIVDFSVDYLDGQEQRENDSRPTPDPFSSSRFLPFQDDTDFLSFIERHMNENGLLRISVSRLADAMGQDPATVRSQVRRICHIDSAYPAFRRRPGGLTVYDPVYMNMGLHLAVTATQLRHIRSLPTLTRRVDYILDSVYPAVRSKNPCMACSITYAWESIGKIIGTLGDPLRELMGGAGSLGASRSGDLKKGLKKRVLFLKMPALVKRSAEFLRKVSEERVRHAVEQYLGPGIGAPWRSECLFDVQEGLRQLREFFGNAAVQKMPVVFFGGCVT
jgi:hypothetical protein